MGKPKGEKATQKKKGFPYRAKKRGLSKKKFGTSIRHKLRAYIFKDCTVLWGSF